MDLQNQSIIGTLSVRIIRENLNDKLMTRSYRWDDDIGCCLDVTWTCWPNTIVAKINSKPRVTVNPGTWSSRSELIDESIEFDRPLIKYCPDCWRHHHRIIPCPASFKLILQINSRDMWLRKSYCVNRHEKESLAHLMDQVSVYHRIHVNIKHVNCLVNTMPVHLHVCMSSCPPG